MELCNLIMDKVEFINIPCNLCGSTNNCLLFEGVDRLHGFYGQFKYVKCGDCGLVFMNPQISFEYIHKFYPQDYAPHNLKYINDKTDLDIDSDILNTINADSKVLDIGCGNGQFLANLIKTTKCQGFGLDLSENAAKAAKAAKKNYGINVFQGTVEDSPYSNGFFDVITAWSFIEHTNNPLAVLKKTHSLLRHNGYLILKTPNVKSLNASIFKDKWYHLDCPRHLFLFSPKTMNDMLISSGFNVIKLDFDKTSKGIRASLQYLFYKNNYNLLTKNKIRRSKIIKSLISPIAKFIWLIKKSDTMTIYAKKINE